MIRLPPYSSFFPYPPLFRSRPGLPLYLFLMDFVDGRRGHTDTKFVNSVEQMQASRCYQESREPKKLGCTSCHDPHRAPAPRSEEHTSELQSHVNLVCRLLLE